MECDVQARSGERFGGEVARSQQAGQFGLQCPFESDAVRLRQVEVVQDQFVDVDLVGHEVEG